MTWEEWDQRRINGTIKDVDVATMIREWAAREKLLLGEIESLKKESYQTAMQLVAADRLIPRRNLMY